MRVYSRVKVLKFEGYGAEIRCEEAVNKGIKKGWQPINMASFRSPDSGNLQIIAFMGKLKKVSRSKGKDKEMEPRKEIKENEEQEPEEDETEEFEEEEPGGLEEEEEEKPRF